MMPVDIPLNHINPPFSIRVHVKNGDFPELCGCTLTNPCFLGSPAVAGVADPNGWGFEGPEKLWLCIYIYISTYKEKMQPQFVFDVVFYPFLEVASLD